MTPVLRTVATAVRWITAAALLAGTLLALGSDALLHRAVAFLELLGIILLLVPRFWPAGGVLLLVVFAIAAIHHGAEGAKVVWFVYPSLVIVLLITVEHSWRRVS